MPSVRTSLFAAAVSCAAVVVAAPAEAAGATYVALGDSYSSGVGAGNYDGSVCLRSANAYPEVWANAHPAHTLAFVACSGAKTNHVLDYQLSALTSNARLVTITIGGNDIGFANIVAACVSGSDQKCQDEIDRSTKEAETELPPKLDRTYAAIRQRAPNARVIVLGYPRIFVAGPAVCGMSLAKRTALNEWVDNGHRLISGRAAAANFAYEDTRDDFAGHGVCSSDPWFHPYKPLRVVESYHPTAEGQRYGYYAALAGRTG